MASSFQKKSLQVFKRHLSGIQKTPLQAFKKKKKIGLHSSVVTGVVPDGVAYTFQVLLRHHFQAHQYAIQVPFSSDLVTPFRRFSETIQGAFQAPFKAHFKCHSRRTSSAIQGALQVPFKVRSGTVQAPSRSSGKRC